MTDDHAHDGFDEDAHTHLADDDHDDHGHPPEDPKWVLLPLAVGFVIGVIVLVVLGIDAGAAAFV